MYAQYDYEAENEDELSFKLGDRLQVLRKVDEVEKGWWWARKVDSPAASAAAAAAAGNSSLSEQREEGYIPRNLFSVSLESLGSL